MSKQKKRRRIENFRRVLGLETEKFTARWSFVYSFGKFVFIYLGLFVLFLSFLVILSYNLYSEKSSEYLHEAEKFEHWKSVSEDYPDYPDAFYMAGYYAYRLGREEQALVLVENAILLDEYFDEAKQLRQEIITKL